MRRLLSLAAVAVLGLVLAGCSSCNPCPNPCAKPACPNPCQKKCPNPCQKPCQKPCASPCAKPSCGGGGAAPMPQPK